MQMTQQSLTTTWGRCERFSVLFSALQNTTSLVEKNRLLTEFREQYPLLIDDLTYIFETLDGRHPIGWTFRPKNTMSTHVYDKTIRECILLCTSLSSHSVSSTTAVEIMLGYIGNFLAPIVNRTLRLGIGRSQLGKTEITPMLAKKYTSLPEGIEFAVTEKLDGNRCIASFVNERWQFTSRNGKPMRVSFDMTGFDPQYIYDGEVMTPRQVELSIKRANHAFSPSTLPTTEEAQLLFNEASGKINSKTVSTDLVYNVFDITNTDLSYLRRRELLLQQHPTGNVRVLPLLYSGRDQSVITDLLDIVTLTGGEGVMINLCGHPYQHKRTDSLLKCKKVNVIDMRVIGIEYGEGKYAGMVGALLCSLVTSDGKFISAKVGSGLSDDQRLRWSLHPAEIRDKIVKVGYHEITQSADNIGSDEYSLRFPRLLSVRVDKTETSEY